MHFLGLAGMPRRIPDFPDAYLPWNIIASCGSIITVTGMVFFLFAYFDIQFKGKVWEILGKSVLPPEEMDYKNKYCGKYSIPRSIYNTTPGSYLLR
jgi:heme/copper-type cytochrome/quinol oxidase subunit 1